MIFLIGVERGSRNNINGMVARHHPQSYAK